MHRVLTLCMIGAALGMGSMPAAYWKNLAHGVNSRSVYSPGKLGAWSAELNKMNCTLPTYRTPFDSMTTHGPSGVNPVDGSIVVGLICDDGTGNGWLSQLPYLWVIPQRGGPKVIQLVTQRCASMLREADIFEGNLNFLPDGGVIFGLCGNLYVLPLGSTTPRNLGGWGSSSSIISVINCEPQQIIIAGGHWEQGWEDWRAIAVNVSGKTSDTIDLKSGFVGIADTTIMFSADGKTMYNGHFDRWSPGNSYGLQYWSTPFTTSSAPHAVYPQCSQTRPWTYVADGKGNVYSSSCGPLLTKLDKEGNQVWNVSCPRVNCYGVETNQVAMTDDERYVYVGTTRVNSYYKTGSYYIVDSHTGVIVKTLNITDLAQEGHTCATIYGPFASRWPAPLVGKTRALFQCSVSTNITTVYSFDPMAKNFGLKKYNVINSFAPIMLTDSSDNVYVIGTNKQHAFVKRFPA